MSGIVSRFDFKTIVAGVLSLIRDNSKLSRYYKYINKKHQLFFKNDKTEDRADLREVVRILCMIKAKEEDKNLSLEAFDAKISGEIMDEDEANRLKQKYISWKMDQSILDKINDKGCFSEFLDYLKILQLFDASNEFSDKYQSGSVDAAIDVMNQAFHRARQLDTGRHDILDTGEIIKLLKKEDNYSSVKTIKNLMFGLEPFDAYTGGFNPQTLNIFLSKTNGGKSMMAVHLIRMCIEQEIYCWVGVVEDPKKTFMYRLISSVTGIRISRLRNHPDMLTRDEWNNIEKAQMLIDQFVRVEFIYGKDVFEVDKLALDYDLECEVINKPKPTVNIVDYSGHIASKSPGDQMHTKYRNTFAERKDFALENNKIVFDFAQVNRDGAQRITGNNLVSQENLAGAYDLAQVCDNIISINQSEEEKAIGRVNLFFTKAKDGFTGYAITVKSDFHLGRYNMSYYKNEVGEMVKAWEFHPSYRPPDAMLIDLANNTKEGVNDRKY